MPNDFAGLDVKPGESTALYKVENPMPPAPQPPKPPVGWDKKPSYQLVRAVRKGEK